MGGGVTSIYPIPFSSIHYLHHFPLARSPAFSPCFLSPLLIRCRFAGFSAGPGGKLFVFGGATEFFDGLAVVAGELRRSLLCARRIANCKFTCVRTFEHVCACFNACAAWATHIVSSFMCVYMCNRLRERALLLRPFGTDLAHPRPGQQRRYHVDRPGERQWRDG